jgi:hydroxyacylglutathione hydrolase
MELSAVPALSPRQVRECIDGGRLVVDTRQPALFGAAHIPGSLNIQIASSQFEQRVGWVVPPEHPIILVTNRPEEVRHAHRLLAFVGLDHRLEGFLEGGLSAWRAEGGPYESIDQVEAHELHALVNRGGITVLDVREADEWQSGHVEGSVNVSYKELARRLTELGLPSSGSIACMCEAGYRASTAASILKGSGFPRVLNVTGGFSAWRRAGLPVATSESPRQILV